jgi:hypothetical protein
VEICFCQIPTGEPPGSMLFENQARKLKLWSVKTLCRTVISNSECRIC